MSLTVVMGLSYTPRIGEEQYARYRKECHSRWMDDQSYRLRAARIAAGYPSAAAAARALGIPEGRYSHHENGTRSFNYDAAQVYAAKFATTADWLMSGKARFIGENGPRQTREVTKLSWVSAGRLGPADPVESINNEGRFKLDLLPPGDWVALEVRGRSMERVAPPGSLIVVNRRDHVLVNKKFYVITAEDGEATFKKYRSVPDRFLPFSLDEDEEPIYPDLEPDRGWRVFGRVHKVLIDL